MIFHLGFELPETPPVVLDEKSPELTPGETAILKDQILKNTRVIGEMLTKLDLFVNKERYPQDANCIRKIRRRLNILIEENDTFRAVLWRQWQLEDAMGGSRRGA
ncbi:MAG: hypothetical protein ACOY3K_01965 [Candidatus Omnitrophota bacterium]